MEIGGSVEGMMAFVNEISDLKVELCKRDMECRQKDTEIESLKEEVERLRRERNLEHARCEQLECALMSKNVEANFFRNFYLLSTIKVKRFFTMLKDLHARSFLHSCICSCLPDNAPAEVRNELDSLMTMALPEESARVDINVQGNLQTQDLKLERLDVMGDAFNIHDNPNAKFNMEK